MLFAKTSIESRINQSPKSEVVHETQFSLKNLLFNTWLGWSLMSSYLSCHIFVKLTDVKRKINENIQVSHQCTVFIYLIKHRNNIDGDSNQRSLSLRSCRSSRSRLSSSRSRSLSRSRSRSRSRSLSLSRSRSFRFAATATKKTLILKLKQECIPVGCVPAARRPYAGVCFPGGVCLVPGGLSAWSRGGLPDPGGSAWSWGGGAVCLVGGGHGIPAGTEADPPVDRQTPVKTLPWPQLRCGR